jgi:hypothetical protein
VSDSGPGVLNMNATDDMDARVREWHWDEAFPPSCGGCNPGHGQPIAMYGWMLERDPSLQVSIVSFEQDETIAGFLRLTPEDYEALLEEQLEVLRPTAPARFHTLLAEGQEHVLLIAGPSSIPVGMLTSGGASSWDWTSAMLRGDDAVWKDDILLRPTQ